MKEIARKQPPKDKQRRFKLSEEEDNKLIKLVHERNCTISEYIRQCCLNENTIPVIERSSEILQHVACLSTKELPAVDGYKTAETLRLNPQVILLSNILKQ